MQQSVSWRSDPGVIPAILRRVARFPSRFRRDARHRRRPDCLVLSGGGMKGMVGLGALMELEAAGELADVDLVVGSSIGAVLGAALVTRQDLRRVVEVVAKFAYSPRFDFGGLKRSAGFGLDRGAALDELISNVLGPHAASTLADVDGWGRARLVVCVTDLDARRPLYVSAATHPDMLLAEVLRASCAIPLLFTGVHRDGHVWVDGSLCDNFPYQWAVDVAGARRVLGVRFVSAQHAVDSFETYALAVIESAISRQAPARSGDTLTLDVGEVGAIQFSMTPERRRSLVASGRRQALAWLKKIE